jgi:hypothetical protein
MRWSENQYADYLQKKGITPETEKQPKYRNRRVRVDGMLFDSQLEADYYCELKLQLKAGEINGFCRQPEFILVEGLAGQKPVMYKADFIVFNLDGTAEIIDTKGMETEIFKLKHKQFKAKFPNLELKVEKKV